MDIQFQHPKPGAKIQVIGAGLPRTGTNSFCAALSILLDGPSYHAGVQWATGSWDESHVKIMIEAARDFPYHSQERKRQVLRKLDTLLDGYVSTNDPPLTLLVPELMELYPDALVICTMRDRANWATSMMQIIKTSQPRLAGFIFFWIPSVRYLPELSDGLTNLFYQRFGVKINSIETCFQVHDRHGAWLEEVVPKEKLIYYNVKDGWEPLCRALGLKVPDTPFPRLNDSDSFEKHFKNLVRTGLIRWTIFLATSLGLVMLARRVLSPI